MNILDIINTCNNSEKNKYDVIRINKFIPLIII